MKVEILEKRLSSTDPETGRHYLLEQGDRITVSDECGKEWCSAGWAKDLEGNVEVGERRVVSTAINPESSSHKTTGEEA